MVCVCVCVCVWTQLQLIGNPETTEKKIGEGTNWEKFSQMHVQARKHSLKSKSPGLLRSKLSASAQSSCQLFRSKLENNKQPFRGSGCWSWTVSWAHSGLRSGSLLQLGTQPRFLTLSRLESSFKTSSLSAEIKWLIPTILCVSDCG